MDGKTILAKLDYILKLGAGEELTAVRMLQDWRSSLAREIEVVEAIKAADLARIREAYHRIEQQQFKERMGAREIEAVEAIKAADLVRIRDAYVEKFDDYPLYQQQLRERMLP